MKSTLTRAEKSILAMSKSEYFTSLTRDSPHPNPRPTHLLVTAILFQLDDDTGRPTVLLTKQTTLEQQQPDQPSPTSPISPEPEPSPSPNPSHERKISRTPTWQSRCRQPDIKRLISRPLASVFHPQPEPSPGSKSSESGSDGSGTSDLSLDLSTTGPTLSPTSPISAATQTEQSDDQEQARSQPQTQEETTAIADPTTTSLLSTHPNISTSTLGQPPTTPTSPLTLPTGAVRDDDFSISTALARAVRDTTGQTVHRVAGLLAPRRWLSSHRLVIDWRTGTQRESSVETVELAWCVEVTGKKKQAEREQPCGNGVYRVARMGFYGSAVSLSSIVAGGGLGEPGQGGTDVEEEMGGADGSRLVWTSWNALDTCGIGTGNREVAKEGLEWAGRNMFGI